MGKCAKHPDRETNFVCMKHNIYMCEECIECRDPEIYCKFRSSCPIWFMYKEKKRAERKKEEKASVKKYKVIFLPDNKEVTTIAGTNLLEAAKTANISLNAS